MQTLPAFALAGVVASSLPFLPPAGQSPDELSHSAQRRAITSCFESSKRELGDLPGLDLIQGTTSVMGWMSPGGDGKRRWSVRVCMGAQDAAEELRFAGTCYVFDAEGSVGAPLLASPRGAEVLCRQPCSEPAMSHEPPFCLWGWSGPRDAEPRPSVVRPELPVARPSAGPEPTPRPRATGEPVFPYLGAVVQYVTPELEERLHLPRPGGALLAVVAEDTPAASAGLREQDVVVSFNADPVEGAVDLVSAICAMRVGEGFEAIVVREGEYLTISGVIGGRPEPGGCRWLQRDAEAPWREMPATSPKRR